MIGTTLQHYKIIGLLGKGGMGEVYVAEDMRLKRKVALKVLPSEIAGDPDRAERFQREAEASAALNHPNIVTIHFLLSVTHLLIYILKTIEWSEIGQSVQLRPQEEVSELLNVCLNSYALQNCFQLLPG